MSTTTEVPLTAPYRYFGGKGGIARLVWRALGNPSHYIEPFCGSAAVLLARRHYRGRVETINDADGWLVNAWRAIRYAPDDVADLFTPQRICEADYHAALAWLHDHSGHTLMSWLEADPEHYDTRAASWWIYAACWSIGSDYTSRGMWTNEGGYLTKTGGDGIPRSIPALSNTAPGVYSTGDPRAHLNALSDRLREVRITSGDWARVLTPSVTPSVTRCGSGGDCPVGLFLDPPYSTSPDMYAAGADVDVSADVRDWCMTAPADWRIVLCGYDDDHDELLDHGWTKVTGQSTTSGFTHALADSHERVWLSPTCLPTDHTQAGLF